MWTRKAVQAHQRGLACARRWEEAVAKLEALAQANPYFAERVADLRAALDHLRVTCETAIAIDATGDEEGHKP